MSDVKESQHEAKYPATVAAVINESTVVINRGSRHGVTLGQRFLVYALSEDEIKDPISGESLGRIELVRGKGEIVNVQDQMSTLKSETVPPERRILRKTPWYAYGDMEEVLIPSTYRPPFESPKVGDKAKPL